MKSFWDNSQYFKKSENWGDWKMMDEGLMWELESMRKYIDKTMIIHCGYEKRDNADSTHNLGIAVDLHIVGLNLIDQFLLASRFNFNGIGVYDNKIWNNPGLHLDKREGAFRKYWGCTKVGGKPQYVALDNTFIKGIVR